MDFAERDDLAYRGILESIGVSPRSKAEMMALMLESGPDDGDSDEVEA